jgi:Flp pilus assembly protein TadG
MTAARRDEMGQVAVIFPMIVAILFVFGALLIDGGFVRAAKRQAVAEANATALDAARSLDLRLLRSTGEVRVDPAGAAARARAFMAPTGHKWSLRTTGDRVDVSVEFNQRTPLLSVVGIHEITVRGRSSARLAHGPASGP